MKTRIYECAICGNVVIKLVDGGPVPVCCDENMEVMRPNEVDAKHEYHLPVVKRVDDHCIHVSVGQEQHPMTDQHHIVFVLAVTSCGWQVKFLDKGSKPEATFVSNEPFLSVYTYCNLHGLWMTPVK